MFNIQVTAEHVATEEILRMNKSAAMGLVTLCRHADDAYKAFWYGSVSPSIKVQLLGTMALEVFTKSAQAQAFLASNIADYVPLTVPPEYAIEWYPDGSATITVLPPEEPPAEEPPTE